MYSLPGTYELADPHQVQDQDFPRRMSYYYMGLGGSRSIAEAPGTTSNRPGSALRRPQLHGSARSCLVANFGGGRSLESTNQGCRATREVKTFNLIGWGSLGGVGGPRTAPLSAPIKTERRSGIFCGGGFWGGSPRKMKIAPLAL